MRFLGLSMSPPRRMSSAVSRSALVTRLVFFCALLIRHLLRQSLFHLYVQFHAVRSEPPRSEFLESRQFVIADVVPFILGKAIKEHRTIASPIGDDCTIAPGTSLPGACDPLFQKSTSEVSVDQALFR